MSLDEKLILAAAPAKTRDVIAFLADVEILAAEADAPDMPEDTPKGPPKFKCRAYNGGSVNLNGWGYPVVVDLAGMKFAKSITANLHHVTENIVGHVTEPMNDGKAVDLLGIVSGTGPSAKEFIDNAANGYPWQASIEAQPTQQADFVGDKEKVTVNGQTFIGPVYVVRKSNLYGIAFLPRGADDRTNVTLAAGAANPKGNFMNPELRAFIVEMGFDPDTLTPEQLIKAEATFKGVTIKAKAAPAVGLDDILGTARAEDDRRKGIVAIVARAVNERPNGNSEFLDRLRTLADVAIEAGTAVKDFELDILRATRGGDKPIFAQSRPTDSRMSNDVLQAAICMSGGMSADKLDKQFSDQTLQAAHTSFPNGIGLKQMLILAARQNGWRGESYGDATLEIQQYAFGQHRDVRAGATSTLSLPGIFSNAANKFLLDGWGASDMTWQAISARRSVRDFKTSNSYRLGGQFKYQRVGPGGEIKQGTVSEDSYSNKAETYGIRFSITREDIVNDDLSAMTAIPKEMGFGAADSMNEVFWTAFLNNSTFFASGNNNISAGVFGEASLTAAEAVFMAQTKPNGQPLAVTPTILLVPSSLKRAALKLMNSTQLIDGTATAAQGSTNTFAGNFTVVSSPFLSNVLFTGYSSAAYYLLADPNRLATIEVALLNGKDTPTVEEAVADSNVLGFTMRAYHDFGVSKQEPRAGVRSTGA